jgi:hypothetical protein
MPSVAGATDAGAGAAHTARMRRIAPALALIALAGLSTTPASAAPTDPGQPADGPTPGCVRNLKLLSFDASPSRIDLGDRSTLSWHVRVPGGCGGLALRLHGRPVPRQGTLVVKPNANQVYELRAHWAGRTYGVGSQSVSVTLPKYLTIASNDLTAQLEQALGTPGTHIRVRNHVRMRLYGIESRTIPVAGGVRLLGGRTAKEPGPLLYTNEPRRVLLSIQGDDVRIAGLRIRGAHPVGIAEGETNCCSAIAISSKVNVEIDHNELYGWRHATVEIRDPYERIDYFAPFDEVRIHDNFIHHNQSYGRMGYGITVKDDSYASIYRNVFDYNRHAIESDGSTQVGYRAHENLVLENGGYHRRTPFGTWFRTHQFDMHGQESCGPVSIVNDSYYNCGTAGHDMDIRFNSFLYTADEAVRVRGTPGLAPIGVTVRNNVFKHEDIDDAVGSTAGGAGIDAPGAPENILDSDFMAGRIACDVDDDGTTDWFLATGQTWWYSSGRTRPWVFLRRSSRRPSACPTPPRGSSLDRPPADRNA